MSRSRIDNVMSTTSHRLDHLDMALDIILDRLPGLGLGLLAHLLGCRRAL